MVKTYSLKSDGNRYISKNFIIKEFACRDGSDKILIDLDLVEKLQQLRDYLGKPIIITSGYRTSPYNKACGGASNSYHLKGMAVDIYCKDVDARIIALWAEFNGLGGVGLYVDRDIEFVHMDTRESKYRWINKNNKSSAVSNIFNEVIKKAA